MSDLEQILDDCLEEMANGTSTLERCLVRYPHEAAELEPLLRAAVGLGYGREIRLAPGFKVRTRSELVRYMQAHPRGAAGGRSPATWPFWRFILPLTLLLVFVLGSGTAYAQRAVPGDSFYSWKLTSEHVWRLVSSDPVGIDLALADRRIEEYLSVANDPGRSRKALNGYGEILRRLRSETDSQTRVRIVPVLEAHSRSLKDRGAVLPQLDELIRQESGVITAPASSPAGAGVDNVGHGSRAGGTPKPRQNAPAPPSHP